MFKPQTCTVISRIDRACMCQCFTVYMTETIYSYNGRLFNIIILEYVSLIFFSVQKRNYSGKKMRAEKRSRNKNKAKTGTAGRSQLFYSLDLFVIFQLEIFVQLLHKYCEVNYLSVNKLFSLKSLSHLTVMHMVDCNSFAGSLLQCQL